MFGKYKKEDIERLKLNKIVRCYNLKAYFDILKVKFVLFMGI